MGSVQDILFVDGWASAVRVRRAVGWFARARGVWPDRFLRPIDGMKRSVCPWTTGSG